MHPDKDRFRAALKKVEKAPAPSNQNVKALKQAAIRSRWLVNDSNWDTYLTWIQADIEQLNGVIRSAREIVEDALVVNQDELMKAKIVLLEAKAMKQALDIAVSYPTQIIKDKKDLDNRQKDLNLEED